jgi:hypothetical protein
MELPHYRQMKNVKLKLMTFGRYLERERDVVKKQYWQSRSDIDL